MGFFDVYNRKVTELVDDFCNRDFSPDGDRIHIVDVKDRRGSGHSYISSLGGSLEVWYSINDELEYVNNQKYQGYLRRIEASEDLESLRQILIIDSTVALDESIPKAFYTNCIDRIVEASNYQNGLYPLKFSQLVTNVDDYVFENSYLDRCGFFNGQPAYTNRMILVYDDFENYFKKNINSVSGFDKQNEVFCTDVLRISEYLRQQFTDNFMEYVRINGFGDYIKK